MAELSTLLDNIRDTMIEAASLEIAQSYDELTANIPQTPTLQVYPDRCPQVSVGSGTDRVTFGSASKKAVIRKSYIIHADLFVAQRHYIAQDMKTLVEAAEEIDTILGTQEKCNIFGDINVSHFKWEWRRVLFSYSGRDYIGIKYVFDVEML